MAAGSIVIDILAKTGSFETDTARAAKALQKFEKQAVQTGKVIGVALGAAAVAAVALFQSLTDGAAQFKDLEETTGASAENIASFAVAAATAGVGVEEVAGAMNKLTKNLVGVDDESKAAGAALKSLGLNVDDFKKLDPAAQYEAVGKALSGYADGASKVAVAQALFGKSGAEQLKVFKALEEAGGRQTILTQRQIELADEYADRQAKARKELQLYAQAAATEALPALTDLTKAVSQVLKELMGVDKAGGDLKKENAIKSFAEGAADAVAFLADSLVATVRVVQAVAASFKSVGADLYFVARAAALVTAPTPGNFNGFKAAFEQRQTIAAEANQKYLDLLNKDAARFRNALSAAREAGGGGGDPAGSFRASQNYGEGMGRPVLAFAGAEKAAKVAKAAAKDAQSEADKYLQSLRDQLTSVQELTTYEKLLADIRIGKLKGVDPFSASMASLSLAAKEVDATKELTQAKKDAAQSAEEAARRESSAIEERRKSVSVAEEANEQLREEIAIAKSGEVAKRAIERARLDSAISVREEARATAELNGADEIQLRLMDDELAKLRERAGLLGQRNAIVDESAKSAKSAADELGMSFQSAFEDAIVDGERFGDVLKALERDLIRIALRRLVIEPAVSGITGAIKGWGSSSGGDGTWDTGTWDGNHASGLDYVPYDGYMAKLHKGEKVQTASDAGFERRNGDMKVTVNNNNGSNVRTQRTGNELQVFIDAAVSEVSRQIRGGGQVQSALKSRDGGFPTFQR